MPDRRRHRGSHPQDEQLFAKCHHMALRSAAHDYSWLLTRRYADKSALKLVGDRHGLTARQRTALMRAACSDQARNDRTARMTTAAACRGQSIGIDGFNLLITIESALSGALILIGLDGCYRDLASIHGTYRKVQETTLAVEVIADYLGAFDISRIDWYLDRPVSNSGRLKALMADTLEAGQSGSASSTVWNIELVDSPDAVLADYEHPIATADSAILDRCGPWLNLAAEIIDARVPHAWKFDFRGDK